MNLNLIQKVKNINKLNRVYKRKKLEVSSIMKISIQLQKRDFLFTDSQKDVLSHLTGHFKLFY